MCQLRCGNRCGPGITAEASIPPALTGVQTACAGCAVSYRGPWAAAREVGGGAHCRSGVGCDPCASEPAFRLVESASSNRSVQVADRTSLLASSPRGSRSRGLGPSLSTTFPVREAPPRLRSSPNPRPTATPCSSTPARTPTSGPYPPTFPITLWKTSAPSRHSLSRPTCS